MGGDYAPDEIIKGAVESISEIEGKILLVGPKEVIEKKLRNYNYNLNKLEIIDAPDVIEMGETPAKAVRQKKDSSISVGVKLMRNGKADALVSAGSTGAVMAASLLKLGRIKGVKRPAIATVMPALEGETLVLDVGANVDSTPENMVQYALMGNIYAEQILHKSNPQIGLLSIGEEAKKGNELTKETHKLLKNLDINFIGNVEGRDIFTTTCDVVVCDGFVGNTILKTAEGLGKTVFEMMKKELNRSFINKLGAWFMESSLKQLKKKMDYAEYGGAPLLGVNGVVIIGHGSSKNKAIKNAIDVACESVKGQVLDQIKENINERTDRADG
nr:phosphate acyltransferase PlsX [Sporohalobacter salinus]